MSVKGVGGGVLAAVVLLVGPAMAEQASPGTNPFRWAGLYFGAQAGYEKVDNAETWPPNYRYGAEGAVAGGFLGYNRFLSGNMLAGVEIEGNFGDLTGNLFNPLYGPYYKHDWSAAARLRLGVMPAPNALFYASAGAALGHFDYNHGYWSYGGSTTATPTLLGLQLGVGAEAFVTSNLSVRGEAIFTHYATGRVQAGGPGAMTFSPDTLTARVGIAFHPGWLGGPEPAVVEAPAVSWNGFYAGGQAGLTMVDSTESNPTDPSIIWDFPMQGVTAGLHAGVNREFGMWVAGLEGDADLQAVDYSRSTGIPYAENAKQTWSAAVRARLGLLAMHNVLVYGTVGWSAGAFDYSGGYWVSNGFRGATFTAGGLQFGGGVETFLTSNVSLRVEGLYTDYGTHTFTLYGTPDWQVDLHTLETRIGVSYHFN